MIPVDVNLGWWVLFRLVLGLVAMPAGPKSALYLPGATPWLSWHRPFSRLEWSRLSRLVKLSAFRTFQTLSPIFRASFVPMLDYRRNSDATAVY